MIGRIRLLTGISVLWLPMGMLFDGLTTLLLPAYLLALTQEATRATVLGMLTFSGLIIGMIIQPIAGGFSDYLYPRWGRRGMITLGVVLLLPLIPLLAVQ